MEAPRGRMGVIGCTSSTRSVISRSGVPQRQHIDNAPLFIHQYEIILTEKVFFRVMQGKTLTIAVSTFPLNLQFLFMKHFSESKALTGNVNSELTNDE